MSKVAFGRVVNLITEKAVNRDFRIGLEAIESGTGRLVADPVTDYQGEGTAFEAGDVLFGKLRPNLAKAWVAQLHGAAVGDFHVYRPVRGRALSAYLRYVLLSREFLSAVESSVFGAKMPRASWGFIRSVEIYVPRLDEQRAIADFLDRETVRIDTLIQEQQRLVEILRERRHVARATLATGGLGELGATIETGLFWAPEIPAKWTVVPLTSVATLESGHTPSRERAELWKDCYIPWISLNDVGELTSNEYISATTNLISDAGIAASSARLLPAGTVVLSRDATIGRSSIMAVPMATSQHFADWVCGPNLDPRYLWLLFTSAMQAYFDSLTNGSTLRTIGMGALKAFRIPLPPIDEQRRIVERASEQTAKIDSLISETERFIELVHERRSALITAAVTGQIDVREAA